MSRYFKKSVLAVILCVGALPLIYNNCAKGFQIVPSDSIDQSSVGELPTSNGGEFDWISLRAQGTLDPSCMSNAAYDSCIFFKNPFVQNYILTGSALPALLVQGANLSSIQTFGVNFKNRVSSSTLESASHKLMRGQPLAGQDKPVETPVSLSAQIKIPYAGDSNLITSMANSYFWTEEMAEQLKTRTGIYYASGKKVDIFILDQSSGVKNNAFWAGFDNEADVKRNWVSIGIVDRGRTPKFYEAGLDAEVLLHEMGHANFAFAKGYPNYDIFADNFSYMACGAASGTSCTEAYSLCGSETSLSIDPKMGCQRAINEGLADFFYLMMFPQHPSLWETNYNAVVGVPYRNMLTAMGKSMSAFIPGQICDIAGSTSTVTGSTACSVGSYPGVVRDYAEIHQMGAAYASILFKIYANPATHKRAFEKTFMLHLQQIGPSTRFPEALDILSSIDQNIFGGINFDIIVDSFAQKGVQ